MASGWTTSPWVGNGRRRWPAAMLALAMAAGGLDGLADGSEEPARERPWRIVPMSAAGTAGKTEVRLPPLATPATADQPGDEATWRQTGELPAAFATARLDWQKCLRQQGWQPTRQMPLSTAAGARRELSAWQRRDQRLLLLLWEGQLGRTGFAWGLDQ